MYSIMSEIFSECEQDIIIHEFLNYIARKETAEYLEDKCSKCEECKFNKENLELYKLNLPNDIVKNICKMNYDECYRCHHSNDFISEVKKGKCWRPVDWYLFTNHYDFPEDDEDFEEQFPDCNYDFMSNIYDMMGDKEFKTRKDVRIMIKETAKELNITDYKRSKVVEQFNKIIKWMYEHKLCGIHPLDFYPKLEI